MTKEITQGEWDVFQKEAYPEDVSTGGMGPCTGIIVFDPHSGDAYGTHLSSPHTHDRDTLDNMLAAAQTAFLGKPDIQIWASGCCNIADLEDFHAPTVRSHVESAVRSAFPYAEIDLRWPEDGVTCVEMSLDQHAGSCYIEFTVDKQ